MWNSYMWNFENGHNIQAHFLKVFEYCYHVFVFEYACLTIFYQ